MHTPLQLTDNKDQKCDLTRMNRLPGSKYAFALIRIYTERQIDRPTAGFSGKRGLSRQAQHFPDLS